MKKDSYLTTAKKYLSKAKLFLHSMGPGVVTGAADDDPSGIGTYTQAGAMFGSAFLWTALITWPLMASVQMACARIGMVTGEGLASALEKKFPRFVLVIFCFALFLANTLNVGADLAAMADSAEMLGGGSSHIYVVILGASIAWATVRLRYFHIARVLKWLAISLFSYIIAAFIVGPNWDEVMRDTLFPTFPQSKDQWVMLVAILGTTISPYLFFWQASQEVEEEKAAGRNTLKKRIGATSSEILTRKFDVGIGTFFSNIVMFFIILTTSLTLNKHGLTNIESSRQAAEALVPLAGRFASLLYTAGLLGVGLLAIPTLTGSAAYALAETFGWDQGLDAKLGKARAFYAVIIVSTLFGIIFDFSGINPIKSLYWSAVVNGLLAPFLLLGILFVIRDKVIMKGQPGSKIGQTMVALSTILMFGAAFGMFFL
ncbi:MAG: divalent metal cation transporter [Chitinophagaceae bacterium]|nr:divalent metal cation transporter [Oligoflexus sp.]